MIMDERCKRAEAAYNALDDEHKYLAGVLGCMFATEFVESLIKKVASTFSDSSDNDKNDK